VAFATPGLPIGAFKATTLDGGSVYAIVVVITCVLLTAPALAQTFAEKWSTCLACHGEKGQSDTPEVPSLGGQPAPAMLIQLYLFREKRRQNEIMVEMAKDMTDADLQKYADAIAKLPPPGPPADTPDADRMERGREFARQNRCGICHNADFSGRDNLPRLAAQREDYLRKALREYKSAVRPGYDPAMVEVLGPVSDVQIVDLAYYLARIR
jgi:cytochrome c553